MASPPPGARRTDDASAGATAGAAADRAARLAGARLVGVHAALAFAIGLGGALLYCLTLAPARQAPWVAVDAALLAAALALVHRWRASVGFAALGAHRFAKLAGLTALCFAVVLGVQLVIADANLVSLDESQYLEAARRGELLRHGLSPFSLRWLVPMLAGRWNLLPVDGALAIKAINFGAFAVTGVYLSLLLVRLRVPLGLAALAPLVLFASYLGVYGATNRLVIDAFNYALFALLLHALVRPEHARLFAALLLLASFNSEKAICWVPVFAAAQLLRGAGSESSDGSWTLAAWRAAALATLRVAAPALLYLVAIYLYAAPARAELLPCPDLLQRMAFAVPRTALRGSCAELATHQIVWFPFGAFSLFALLGLRSAPRWLRALPLLLGAVLLQALVASDAQRMLAYSFIVYVPLGFLYLARAEAELPPRLGRALIAAIAAVALAQHYLIPLAHQLELAVPDGLVRRALSALELLLVGALLFLHLAVYADRAPHERS